MEGNQGNSWDQQRALIQYILSDHTEQLRVLRRDVAKNNERIAILWVRVAIYSAIASTIVGGIVAGLVGHSGF